uniref:Uncharacterized protein n=2 Tax=Babesia bovis TaxID=5865 RepID=S6CB54_BABBO|nr:hypothetical protein [Babesia bovis]
MLTLRTAFCTMGKNTADQRLRYKSPRPNYALSELTISSLIVSWVFTNVSLLISLSVGILLMRRVLRIATFVELFGILKGLVYNPRDYHNVAVALLKNSPPTISHMSLVYFGSYFSLWMCLFLYVNMLIIKCCCKAVASKYKWI